MKPGFSLYLDALRLTAAIAVLLGHLAHARFTQGNLQALRDLNIASDAVVVFFVLSGLVIAYAAERDGTLGRFAFNRTTRLFSVIIPALLLTLVFDGIGTRVDMSAYPKDFYSDISAWEVLLRGLTFSNEWVGLTDRVRIGTNGPLWSLSYEAIYYAVFASCVFLRGNMRIAVIGVMIILVGLPILALAPCWFLGVWAWRQVKSKRAMSRTSAWGLAITAPVFFVASKWIGLPQQLTEWTMALVAPTNLHILLAYSDEVFWNTLLAGSVALHLIGVSSIVRNLSRVYTDNRSSRAVKWTAGASFSIYVVHYPTLHLIDALFDLTSKYAGLLALIGTLCTCLVFAQIFERSLASVRRALVDSITKFSLGRTPPSIEATK
ncbi:acyltransferase [uncultured Litoreibacter sp.]|uniref:acyltransferase family protein n=1 Tax=uncultured Litoreibacter sp. TaxID=1392394 RepID=UPI00262D783C|nr:acyltransferase [uncultured Litoreibacter sp.]